MLLVIARHVAGLCQLPNIMSNIQTAQLNSEGMHSCLSYQELWVQKQDALAAVWLQHSSRSAKGVLTWPEVQLDSDCISLQVGTATRSACSRLHAMQASGNCSGH